MKKLLFTLVILPIGYIGSIVFGAVATLNGPISVNTTTLNAGNVGTYWQTCIDETNSNDNIQRALYVDQNIAPKFGYTYSNTNAARARAVLSSTEMLVYNPGTFSSNGLFSFLSNINPNLNSPNSFSTVITQLNNSVLSINNTVGRNVVAGMYILHGTYQTFTFGGNTSANIYGYRTSYTQNPATYFNKNLSDGATPVERYSCVRYFVAKCGDGILDNPNKTCPGGASDCDGKSGISALGQTIPWSSTSPTEQCDPNDATHTNRGNGGCSPTCTQINLSAPTCTLTPPTQNILLGTTGAISWTINGTYTNTPIITYAPTTPSITGLPYTVPGANGLRVFTPTSVGTKTLSMTVMNGTLSNTCTATVIVNPPLGHLSCTLSINPNSSLTNQIVAVGRNVTGGNFYSTQIQVTPSMIGSRPHLVNGNEFNGVTYANANQVGQYIFTMTVQNNYESALCTGVLNVVDSIPPCSLTTTTPNITVGQTAILSGSYSNATLSTMTPSIIGLNFIYPNRSNNNILVNPTVTTTYTLNVFGALGLTNSCSATVNVIKLGLTLSKELVNNVLYHSGDYVQFKINFANNSSGTVNNIILSDTLPLSLEYVDSQIFGIMSPYTFSTGMVGLYEIIEYSGFSLAPGQQGYMLVRGKFKGNNYLAHMINNVFIEAPGVDRIHAAAGFSAYMPSANTSTIKTSNKSSYFLGEDAKFTIAVTNNGPDIINNVTITDIRPDTNCITPDIIHALSNVPITITSTNNPYSWMLNDPLNVGQTIYLYITGHISNTPTCVGTYINNAGITYMINGIMQTGVAPPLLFTVSNIPNATMIFEKRIVQYGNNPGDPVVFELLYQNNGNATITNYDIVDYWPGTLNFISANPMPNTQTPSSGGMLLNWLFTTPLAPNGSGKITINGTIK